MQVETILNALPLPVILCDRRGKILHANSAVETLLGGRLDENEWNEFAAELERGGFFQCDVNLCQRTLALRREGGFLVSVEVTVCSVDQPGEPVTVLWLKPRPSRQIDSEPESKEPLTVPAQSFVPSPRPRLLVVDDEEMVRMVICAVLAQHGYEVVEAEDGEDAIRKCEAGMFDLAVVDLFMPRLNGVETLQRLRRLQPQLRGILLSGVADVDEVAMERDDLTFLQKPFDNLELVQAVANLLAQPSQLA